MGRFTLPKGTPDMRYVSIPGRFNVTDEQLDTALERFHDAPVRGLTEVKGRGSLLAKHGHVVVGDDSALVFKKSVTQSVKWLSPGNVTSLPFSRSKDGWGVATALWTRADGKRAIFSKGHAPAHRILPRNRKAWNDGVDGWAEHIAWLEAEFPGVPIVVDADWNRNLRSAKVRAEIEAKFPGFKFTWETHPANRGTRGPFLIDGPLVSGVLVNNTHVYRSSKGFDHRPSSHDLGEKKVTPVADEPYDIIQFRGAKVDRITAQALTLAEFILGYELTITQGSYNKGGVSASAGTHDGGGVIDLAPFEADRKVRILRALGFAAWHREPIPGLWPEHVHAVLIGNKKLAPAAVNQVASYRAGRDGLKSNAIDKTPRPDPIPVFRWGARITNPRQ